MRLIAIILLTLFMSGCAGMDWKDPYPHIFKHKSIKQARAEDADLFRPSYHQHFRAGNGYWYDRGDKLVWRWRKGRKPATE